MDHNSSRLQLELPFLLALIAIQAMPVPTAVADYECSALTSEEPFPYSESGLTSRNEFLASICGGEG
jgi:hypothetical protein